MVMALLCHQNRTEVNDDMGVQRGDVANACVVVPCATLTCILLY
jgi:hypothetical protein